MLLDEELQVLLVVQDLLDVFLDRVYEKFILFISLLHAQIFFFKRTNTLFNLSQLTISLLQQVL